jgi:ribosomal protein S18 acetylase RimI-like enzyme
MMVEISTAAPDDIDAVAALAQETFDWHHTRVPGEFMPSDPAAVRGIVETARTASGQFLLVAKAGADVVGFVHYYIIDRPQYGALAPLRMGFVGHIAVVAGHRRQGVGHALLEAVRSHLRREGIADLRGNTFAANAASAAFLAAEGFDVFSTFHRARVAP